MREQSDHGSCMEIVNRIIHKKGKEPKKDLDDLFFTRFYNEFDRTIRACLYSRQIDVSTMPEELYDAFFFQIHEAVFFLENFIKKLKKFNSKFNPDSDPETALARWLRQVVRNEVRDWLKKKDLSGLSNKDRIKLGIDIENARVPLEEQQYAPKGRRVEMVGETSPRSLGGAGEKLLERLEERHRVSLRIQFIAHVHPPSSDIDFIAREAGKSKEEITYEVSNVRKELRQKKIYKEHEIKLLQMESLRIMILNSEKRVYALEKKLSGMGCSDDDLQIIREKASTRTFKEIDKRTNHLKTPRTRPARSRTASSTYRKLEEYAFMRACKRHMKNQRMNVELARQYRTGELFRKPRPNARQLGRIFNCSEQAIYNRLNRAKKALLNLIEAKPREIGTK